MTSSPVLQLRLREEFHSIEASYIMTLGPNLPACLDRLARSEASWIDLSPTGWCMTGLDLPYASAVSLTAGGMLFQFQPSLVVGVLGGSVAWVQQC